MDGLLIPTLLNQQKLSNEKRRRSVSLPLSRPGYSFEQKKTSRKGVHFPVSILLQQAITEGDLTEINQLINQHGNKVVMELEPSGLPPVMRSVFEGQVEALKLLVENGAELSTQDPEGWNVLHVAAAMDDIEAATYVLHCCNDSLTQIRNLDGQRPMDLAESPDMAKLLLHADLTDLRIEVETVKMKEMNEASLLSIVRTQYEQGADVNSLQAMLQQHTQFDTLLHLAATKNYPRLAKYILKHKLVDEDFRDRYGWTPLHTAAYHCSVDVTILLLEFGASSNALTNSYEKASDLTEHELILELLSECVEYV